MADPISITMTAMITHPNAGDEPDAALNTWGTVAVRSTSAGWTYINTDPVVRMYSSAITGAASHTDRPILRAGFWDSPEKNATYSNPLSELNPILLNRFRLIKLSAGAASENGGAGAASENGGCAGVARPG